MGKLEDWRRKLGVPEKYSHNQSKPVLRNLEQRKKKEEHLKRKQKYKADKDGEKINLRRLQ